MFDAHCHLDLPAFDGEVSQVLQRARAAGVTGAIVAGVDPPGWARQKALATTFSELHVTYGLHPWAVARSPPGDLSATLDALERALDAEDDVAPVGLGELGLDRSQRVPKSSIPLQIQAFRRQLAMARQRNLPVVLHVVRAHGVALEIVSSDGLPRAGGMVHAFGGSAEVASQWVRLGMHISFSTAVARPQSRRLRAACQVVPPDRLLAETDSPDQSPSPDGHGVNEPANLPKAIAALAAARDVTAEEIAALTASNARHLFGLAAAHENACFTH